MSNLMIENDISTCIKDEGLSLIEKKKCTFEIAEYR